MPILIAALGAVFLVLFALERLAPLRTPSRALLPRLAVNVAVTSLAFATSAAIVRPLVLRLLAWASETPFGLLQLPGMPRLLGLVLGFLLLDLTFYYWHRANHSFPLLWRFHNVHHLDPDLDVSTGFRFHFIEVALSAGFRVVQLAATGVPVFTFALYEVVFQANTLFHHSNLRLPIRLERFLNRFLVTPRMHGIHHSIVERETSSNYSVVLPWWDRLHRTLHLNVPQREIAVGVPGYARPEDNRLWDLLLIPLRPQRVYWRTPEGGVPGREEKGDPRRLAE